MGVKPSTARRVAGWKWGVVFVLCWIPDVFWLGPLASTDRRWDPRAQHISNPDFERFCLTNMIHWLFDEGGAEVGPVGIDARGIGRA